LRGLSEVSDVDDADRRERFEKEVSDWNQSSEGDPIDAIEETSQSLGKVELDVSVDLYQKQVGRFTFETFSNC